MLSNINIGVRTLYRLLDAGVGCRGNIGRSLYDPSFVCDNLLVRFERLGLCWLCGGLPLGRGSVNGLPKIIGFGNLGMGERHVHVVGSGSSPDIRKWQVWSGSFGDRVRPWGISACYRLSRAITFQYVFEVT